MSTAIFITHLPGVVLDGEAQLGPHGTVGLEAVRRVVLLVEPARVVGIGATDPHPALVVEHGEEALLLALDEVKTILKRVKL